MKRNYIHYPDLPSFDDLKLLANHNPQAFNQLRKLYCDSFINSVPSEHQHRLQCLQNRVELELQRAKNPLSGVIMLSGMMHDSVSRLAEGFDRLYLDDDDFDEVRPTAEIIPFKPIPKGKTH